MTTNERTVGRYLRWVLAALSVGAGVIHFAVSGEHYDVSWLHGTFFAVVAWLQLGWAITVVLRPSRKVLATGLLVNAGIIGVWAVSRVWGVPVTPNAWTPEEIALTDALSSSFEAAIVLISVAVLVRPAIAQYRLRPAFAIPGVAFAGLGIAVISSLALTPAFASSHGHGSGERAHSHTAEKGKSAVAALGGQHVHGVKVGDIAAEAEPDQPLDATTRATLKGQLSDARAVAMRYPTVDDAVAAGYRLAGGFAPGSGAHYITYGGMSGPGAVEPTKPLALIYDGTSPTSEIAGLMYYGMGESAPEGFAGPNDHWHRHSNVCIKMGPSGIDVPFPADADVTEAQCNEAQGTLLKITGWMVHAWVVPSWESPLGVFSHDNPNLRCADGTYKSDKSGFCLGT